MWPLVSAKDAEALSFLIVRYLGVMIMMALLAVLAGARWPNKRDALHIAVAGVMIQAIYLGGVWVSIHVGLSAGVAALIVSLQTCLDVCLAHWTGSESTHATDRRCCRRFGGRNGLCSTRQTGGRFRAVAGLANADLLCSAAAGDLAMLYQALLPPLQCRAHSSSPQRRCNACRSPGHSSFSIR